MLESRLSKDYLRRLLGFMEVRLEAITGADRLPTVVFDVVTEIELRGKLYPFLVRLSECEYPDVCDVATRLLDEVVATVESRTVRWDRVMIAERPFVNRRVFREQLHDLISASPSRLLSVRGPRGSGRTHSWRFVRYVAETHAFRPLRINLAPAEAPPTAADIADAICDRLPLPRPVSDAYAALSTKARRRRDHLVGRLVERANSGAPPLLLFIDSIDHAILSADALEMIDHLIEMAVYDDVPGLRIVLLGYPRQLPRDAMGSVLHEVIGLLTGQDIGDALRRVAHDLGHAISDAAVDQAVAWILAGRPDDLAIVDERTRQVIASLHEYAR
ncbi:AAA family ATPase [Hamadaea tsunoensis]|uniref:AAA family ATPase n=1 Tax=Hamadaea tsunoensis TaxID=53368 RepID=UPI000402A0A4|nr:AAA family ATPase [Hamadaea tsunoensis]